MVIISSNVQDENQTFSSSSQQKPIPFTSTFDPSNPTDFLENESAENLILLSSAAMVNKDHSLTATKRRQFPTLPFDLVPEILCLLPVKSLLRFRCVCKSWKSLISDPKFAKKHLHTSKALLYRHHVLLYTRTDSRNLLPWNFPIPSLFSAAVSTVTHTQLRFPDDTMNNAVFPPILRVCSCDGLICFTVDDSRLLLWNPSIRKFNMFPRLKHSGRGRRNPRSLYSIGYDRFTHTYKIVALSFFNDSTNQVRLYTLGSTHSWRRIPDLPKPYSHCISKPGVFANGTINWLAEDDSYSSIVVSFDFEKELYQKLSHPNVGTNGWFLGVLRDCLCIFARTDMFLDVWIMKECGNNEPWTKLYRVPYMVDRGRYTYRLALYNTEDDQVLMYYQDRIQTKLAVYDSKSGTYNMPELQNVGDWMDPTVYVESLISPCS